MRLLPRVVLLGCALVASARAALDPAAILSPRPQGWVVDLAHVLSADDQAALNRLGDAVHARDGAEMAVVTVPTTAGAEHRQFATRLFNRWGIGDRQRDNGLLIFVAVDDHAAEIILGDGIDSDAEVAASDRIMQREMVPLFRRGDNAGAVLAGARACALEFFGVSAAAVGAADPAGVPVEAAAPRDHASPPAQVRSGSGRMRVPLIGIVGGSGVLGLVGWMAGRVWWRRRARRCGRCAMTMQRLAETEDDAQLASSEQLEERLGSVDYDVWLCPGCGAVEKLRYGRWFTRYSRCAQCGSITTSKARTTLVHATTSSTGLVEIHEHCENCGLAQTYTQTTPRLSSSSSRSGSSGFSGGSSSGRGSSGRW